MFYIDINNDDVPDSIITDSDIIPDPGSTFKGYASQVRNPDDVSVVLSPNPRYWTALQ